LIFIYIYLISIYLLGLGRKRFLGVINQNAIDRTLRREEWD